MLNKIRRAVSKLKSGAYAAELKLRGVALGEEPYISGRPVVTVHPDSEARIGARVVLESSCRAQIIGVQQPIVLRAVGAGASLIIGDDCGMSGCTIVAASSITIQDGCLVGSGAMILDSNMHPTHSINRRYEPRPATKANDAVVLERNVFVGSRAIILAGSRVGENSVIAAGSVVRGQFPANSLIAGNPAKVVGQVKV
ncbi:acyltransferase [Microbacterium sp. NPDC086615]|uniref:acyltransferase n=1 Tax=Microbacterium sp. NPDC086615 TaxID=3154865 RepID=UPI003433EBF3